MILLSAVGQGSAFCKSDYNDVSFVYIFFILGATFSVNIFCSMCLFYQHLFLCIVELSQDGTSRRCVYHVPNIIIPIFVQWQFDFLSNGLLHWYDFHSAYKTKIG